MIPAKTPWILKKLFPNYIWDITKTAEKKLYLTFDDGPIPEVTEYVLQELKKFNAKATFFCIGDNIRKHPDIFQKILQDDHTIGNHTMHHIKAWKSNKNKYLENILECEEEIKKHIHYTVSEKIFRPPYGQISIPKFKVIQKMGYKIVLWDTLAKDWKQEYNTKQCFYNVTRNAENGSIVILHDSIKAYNNLKNCLPQLLTYYSEKGFRFEKLEF